MAAIYRGLDYEDKRIEVDGVKYVVTLYKGEVDGVKKLVNPTTKTPTGRPRLSFWRNLKAGTETYNRVADAYREKAK